LSHESLLIFFCRTQESKSFKKKGKIEDRHLARASTLFGDLGAALEEGMGDTNEDAETSQLKNMVKDL